MQLPRQLVALALAASAFGWADTCPVAATLFGPGEVAKQVVASSSHAAHAHPGARDDRAAQGYPGARDDRAVHAHHAGHEAPPSEPLALFQAACPCGCNAAAQPGGTLSRVGYAVTPSLPEAPVPTQVEALADPTLPRVEASLRLIDHVPIPS